MSYQSVDQLQKVLSDGVFSYAKDSKKAAGRALGTIVETLTFYLLESWGFRDALAIEGRIPEYGNPEITHNVEFSLHPILEKVTVESTWDGKSLTMNKVHKLLAEHGMTFVTAPPGGNPLLSAKGVLRNACKISSSAESQYIAAIDQVEIDDAAIEVVVVRQSTHPYAMFECKRVGVEEGMTKGPQTIEKAKQGAYVANTVSSLHKARDHDGTLRGVFHRPDGTVWSGEHKAMLKEVIATDDPDRLRDFVLTVGVVSNHGNWFTMENQNKEMKVLAQSYDWLLFLTDAGLTEFITDVLLTPTEGHEAISLAFLASYGPESSSNMFTKISMNYEAHIQLLKYFAVNAEKVLSWFNVISPAEETLASMRTDLATLAGKNWGEIH